MIYVETLVMGLGAMGSAALYHLARQGAKPVGIDQYDVCHAFGSSHGHSRAFRTFYHDSLYTSLAEAALPLWRELESLSKTQLLILNGAIFFAKPDNERFDQYVRVLDESGTPFELLSPSQVANRFPALKPPADVDVCYTPRAGFLDANRTVQTHVSQALRFGATIHKGVRVLNIDSSKNNPEIETEVGRYKCDRLVLTPGPWTPQILADISIPLRVTRQQKFYFQPHHTSPYEPDVLPVYADFDTQFYGFPYYGPGIKVADDTVGEYTTPDKIDRSLDAHKQTQLQAWLEAIMPGADFSFGSGATCMYTVTPDLDFLIGAHPRNPNILVGAGFSGHGFKFSTLIGLILAELATQGRTTYPIERFRLDRFHEV